MATNEDIVNAIDGLATTLNGGFKDLKDSMGDQDKQGETQEAQKKGIMATAKEVPIVGKAVKLGSEKMTEALKQSLKLQEKSLGRGLSLDKVMTRQADTTKYLSDGMTGYGKAIEIAYQKIEAGTNNNVDATNKLALYTNLTGGNSKKMLKEMAQLNMGMNMSIDQEASLSQSLMSLSQGFNMTTEELMATIKGLEKSMPMFKIMGIAPEIAEATARLGAALGQESGTMASDMMESLLSAEGAILASQLGVMSERNALLKGEGDSTANALKMVEAAGSEAARMYDSYLQGSGDPAIAYKAVADALGPAMAKSALTYKQLEGQADAMNMSISDYVKSVEDQNAISNEFTTTWNNFKDQVFGPLQQGIMWLATKIGDVIFALGPVGVWLARLTVVAGLLYAAAKAKAVVGGIAKMGKGAAAAAPAGGGAGGGLGKGLAGLGKGMAGLGKGFGKMVEGVLKGVARGFAALGKPKVLMGAAAMLIIAASLVPFAYALTMMKGVGWDTFFMLGAGMLALTLAVAAIGAIMMSGIGAVAIIAGAAAFAILAVALIPLGFALKLAGGGFLLFSTGLAMITPQSLLMIMGLVFALPLLSLALIAFAAGGVVSGFMSLFSGEGPVEKIVKMGKAGKHINKMAVSLKELPKLFERTTEAMAKISLAPFAHLARGLQMVKTQLDKFGILDTIKLAMIGKSVTKERATGAGGGGGGGPQTRKEAFNNWMQKKQDQGPMSYKGKFHQGEFTGTSQGDVQGSLDSKRAKGQFLRFEEAKAAKTASTRDDAMVQDRIRFNQKQIEILQAILDAQTDGNGQRDTANKQRQEQVRKAEPGPSSMGSGRVGKDPRAR